MVFQTIEPQVECYENIYQPSLMLRLTVFFFQLLNFVKERGNGSGLSSQSLSQAVETVKANIAWIQRNEEDLENWLKCFFSRKEN